MRRISKAEEKALRALGYLSEVEEMPMNAKLGVLSHDHQKAWGGLTYFTNFGSCSSHVMDMDGNVVKKWTHSPCHGWDNTVLLPTGEVLAIHHYPTKKEDTRKGHEERSLLKLGPDGSLLWEKKMSVHHDVELTPSGTLATLVYRHRVIPEVNGTIPTRDHFMVLLDRDGNRLEEASLAELLLAHKDGFKLIEVAPRDKDGMQEIDLVHPNSIEWMRHPHLEKKSPIYGGNNVLICMRSQDAIAVIDWKEKKVVWSWGQGILSGPHDATVLPSGNILLFDNGLARKWSQVIELDPLSKKIVWKYRAPRLKDFFSRSRGASQRLENGNTLITNSTNGIIFEVTRGGEVVWSYRNASLGKNKRSLIMVRARRFRGRGSHGDSRYFPSALID